MHTYLNGSAFKVRCASLRRFVPLSFGCLVTHPLTRPTDSTHPFPLLTASLLCYWIWNGLTKIKAKYTTTYTHINKNIQTTNAIPCDVVAVAVVKTLMCNLYYHQAKLNPISLKAGTNSFGCLVCATLATNLRSLKPIVRPASQPVSQPLIRSHQHRIWLPVKRVKLCLLLGSETEHKSR